MRCCFLFIGTVMVVHVTFMAIYKKIAAYLERRPAQPLVHRLVPITDARSKALVLGALLPASGFLLQFVVTLSERTANNSIRSFAGHAQDLPPRQLRHLSAHPQ